MVNIRVLRQVQQVDTTFGVMFIDGYFQCFTLENSHKIIPIGQYPVTLYQSPRFGHLVPLLHGVPNRSMIEIHVGNFYKDFEGCIGVGEFFKDVMLYQSSAAFNKMMAYLKGVSGDMMISLENVK